LRADHAGLKVGGQVSGMIDGAEAPINLVLTGEDYDAVLAAARDLKYEIAAIPGANDVNVSVEAGNPEVRVEVDRDKMARLGLDIASVGATLQNALAGNDDAKFRDGEYEYDIRVQLDAFDRANADDVKDLTFVTASGERVKLSQFAEVARDAAPSMLERRDRRKSVSVTAFTLGVPSGTLSQVIQKKLDGGLLPPGVSYAWEGDVKQQAESFGALGSAFGISLILMYLIMVLLYDSFVYPLVVIASVPVALIGSLYALAITKSTMSVFTILGIIMLLGLVAKNAILIVDFANQAKARGASTREALLEAGKERLRPILMTTIAMVIGMLPIALAQGAGAEWKNGLAWVIIGGLSSSLLLTVFVVPALYELVDSGKALLAKIGSKLRRNTPPDATAPITAVPAHDVPPSATPG
jgi:hydrophobic/amphiphilic exporter-1 (mainly G- bacteria), HAE1 family